ncbi:hypothetical protein GBF38_006392, partial [Nibea albiflora]
LSLTLSPSSPVTEHRISDQVTLNCSVRSYEDRWCEYTVKWLYAGKDVDKGLRDLQTSQSGCSASVTFKTSHFIQTSNSDLLKCEVTDGDRVQRFPFSLQPSGEKPGDDTTKPEPGPKTGPPPTKPGPEPKTGPPPTKPGPEPKTRPPPTTASSMKRGTIMTVSAINDDSANLRGSWWRFIIVSLGLAALIVIVVAVSMWTRTKGRKTQMDENVVSFYSEGTKQRNGQVTVKCDDTKKPEPGPKTRPPPTKPGPEPKPRPPPRKPRPEPKTRPPTTKPGPEPKPRPPPRKPRPEPKTRPPTTGSSMKRGTITTVSTINDDSANLRGSWWRFIIVSLGLAALIVIVVAVSMLTRTKGRKTQMDENVVDDDEDDGAVNYENVTSSV